jgi:hypothetical protein
MVEKAALWELKIILISNILILDFQVNFSMRKNRLEKLKARKNQKHISFKSN